MHELCGAEINNYNSFNWKQTLFRKRMPKNFVKKIRIATFSKASTSRRFGLNGMIGCLSMNNDTSAKLNTSFGTTLSCMLRWLGSG